MVKTFTLIKIILIAATATFVSFHTVIFIKSIEPNPYLAWILAGVIEGFLIILAIQKTIVSKLLLIPLFCISVLSSSASFVVKNEDDLNQILNMKSIIQTQNVRQSYLEKLQKELSQTQDQLQNLDKRYTTKTLERERKIKDLLFTKMEEAQQDAGTKLDYLVIYKSLIFFFVILIVQAVSLYTASHLKNGLGLTEISMESTESLTELSKESTESLTEISMEKGNEIDKDKVISLLKSYKKAGKSLSDLSKKVGISTSTLSKALSYPTYPISHEVFIKIRNGLDGNF